MKEIEITRDEQIRLINSLGDLKTIINNGTILMNLISSNYDRGMLETLFERVNLALEEGTLKPDDLELFRSGWLAERIINLEGFVKQLGRNLFIHEIGDKLNSVAIIKDVPTLIATYTHPLAIKAAGELKATNEINKWLDSGSFDFMPLEARLSVCTSLLKAGYTDKATQLLERMRRREEINRRYNERGPITTNSYLR